MKHRKTLALALAALLTLTALGSTALAANSTDSSSETITEQQKSRSGKGHRHHRIAEPENAVGKDAAKAAALKEAKLSEEQVDRLKVRVCKLEDGTVVYRVSFTYEGQWYCYRIDCVKAEILDKTEKSAAEHEAEKQAKKNASGKAADSNTDGKASRKQHRKKDSADSEANASVSTTAGNNL